MTTKRPITLETLLAMDGRIEIHNGEILAPTVGGGGVHGAAALNLVLTLGAYVSEHDNGLMLGRGTGYLMFSEPSDLHDFFVPDLSFIQRETILQDWDIADPYPGVPDLAIEISLPEDRAIAFQTKIQTYLDKGTQEVWAIHPEARVVERYTRAKRDTANYYRRHDDVIDTQRFFPDLAPLTLKRIFHVPAWLPPKP